MDNMSAETVRKHMLSSSSTQSMEQPLAESSRMEFPPVIEEIEDDYIPTTDDAQITPNNFKPFFTLIQDMTSDYHHHPTVHYIFADDDQDTLTSALTDTIESQNDMADHRVMIIDVGSDCRTITAAHSLSTSWQISKASITSAPSWFEQGAETVAEGLMLRIEGENGPDLDAKEKLADMAEDVITQIEVNVEIYKERLEYLQKLMQ